MPKLKIEWTPVHVTDYDSGLPDENDDGFWPSLDRKAAGWIGDNPERSFSEQQEAAEERMAAFKRGDWTYIGVRARAALAIPSGRDCYRLMTVESAGLWGIESDSDSDYLASVFADEREALKAELTELGRLLAAGELEEKESAVVCE
jgi:hypothetical protein